jgi:hypothetical protein
VVHRADERLTSAAATRPTAFAALSATPTLALTGLAVKVRLAIAAELATLTLRLRLLATTIAVCRLRSAAGATLLAAAPTSPASATTLVRVSVRGSWVCGHLCLIRRAGGHCLVQFIFHRVF